MGVLADTLDCRGNKVEDIATPSADMDAANKKYVDEKDLTTILATENLPAFRAVTADGKIADSSILAHRLKVVGITAAAIANGFSGLVQSGGSIINPGWSWTTGDRIYINGAALSNIPPTAGSSLWSQQIGTAISADAILVSMRESILF